MCWFADDGNAVPFADSPADDDALWMRAASKSPGASPTSSDQYLSPPETRAAGAKSCKHGEKRAGAPPRAESPDWYRRLQRPAGSDDLFHIKRLDVSNVGRLLEAAGLHTRDHEVRRVDEYRTNHFFRLVSGT